MNKRRLSIRNHSTLLKRVKLYAQSHHATVPEVIEQAVQDAITKPTNQFGHGRYTALFKLKGIGKADPRFNKLSVNDILYGKYRKLN